MKRTTKTTPGKITFGLLFLLLLVLAQSAQAQPARKQPKGTVRDFIKQYDAGRIEGIQVTVLLQQGKRFVPVEPRREFKQDEHVKIDIESNFRGYVYVVNLGSSGKKTVIFPDGKESNLLLPGRSYRLPRTYSLVFDEHEGFETLQVFVARQPIPFLTAALKNPGGELNEEQFLAADKLWNNSTPQLAGVVQNDIASNAQQSGGSRDPVWNRRKKATIVAVPANKRPSSQTKRPGRPTPDNRISTFGIKLKNTGVPR